MNEHPEEHDQAQTSDPFAHIGENQGFGESFVGKTTKTNADMMQADLPRKPTEEELRREESRLKKMTMSALALLFPSAVSADVRERLGGDQAGFFEVSLLIEVDIVETLAMLLVLAATNQLVAEGEFTPEDVRQVVPVVLAARYLGGPALYQGVRTMFKGAVSAAKKLDEITMNSGSNETTPTG